jgi:alpha-D-ribose 1-methylphosphonate 5-triphosphate synthase subunit PhnG
MTTSPQPAAMRDRADWMGLLARAAPAQLAACMAGIAPLPAYTVRRAPQTGLVMARGRAGATGDAFNLGEVAATRATVRLEDGAEGHAYVLGRDKAHALNAALCDALMQTDAAPRLRDSVLRPLIEAETARRTAQARKAAATRVEFFTMTRGS